MRSATKRVEAEDRAREDTEENEEAGHPRSQMAGPVRDEKARLIKLIKSSRPHTKALVIFVQ